MWFKPNLWLISVMLNHKSLSGFSSTGDEIESKNVRNMFVNMSVMCFYILQEEQRTIFVFVCMSCE